MIRVAIVDDHPVARRGIAATLAEAADMTVTVSAGSPAELADHTAAGADGPLAGGAPCDVVILDLYHDGDQPCLATIAPLSRATRVLVMSASARPQDVVGAIQAGAMGYLTKHAGAEMLLAAVRTVASGGFALSSELADILQAVLGRAAGRGAAEFTAVTPGPGNPALSRREDETLTLVARGLTHAQIARRMGVTKATVDTYVERIRAKLHLGNKADLTRAALQRAGEATRP